MKGFLAVLAGLTLVRLAFGFGFFAWLPSVIGGALSAAIFIAAPLFGLYQGASSLPKARTAALWLLGGAAVHAGFGVLLRAIGPAGPLSVAVEALAQAGLVSWSFGLGILVGWLVRDKNLLLPVAVFLIGFDVFLVFTPDTFVGNVIRENPQILESVAASVPAAQAPPPAEGAPEGPRVARIAMIGPADLIFCTTFFFILFRFEMNVRKTLRVLIPALVVYLALALAPGVPGLPALVPIGAVVLGVNWRLFELTRDEKLGTLLVGLLSAGLAAYGIWRGVTFVPPKPEAPLNRGAGPEGGGPEAMPPPASPDRSPS
jgi:hypothetical protein